MKKKSYNKAMIKAPHVLLRNLWPKMGFRDHRLENMWHMTKNNLRPKDIEE